MITGSAWSAKFCPSGEAAKGPNTQEAKDKRKTAQDAENEARRAKNALTPDQKKKLHRDLADFYRAAAKQNRTFADEDAKKAREAKAEADRLRKEASAAEDPETKGKLDAAARIERHDVP